MIIKSQWDELNKRIAAQEPKKMSCMPKITFYEVANLILYKCSMVFVTN